MKGKASHRTPLIGITADIMANEAGSAKGQREPVILLHERYARAISQAGAIPLVLPITPRIAVKELLQSLDGVVISGGNFDIHPSIYGEESIEALGAVKKGRTEFELELISLALKQDRPLLGVCGGAQAINVALGGSLYQDIATQMPDAREHQRGDLKEKGGHEIKIRKGTKLEEIVARDTLEVNTTHHQAVKKLGRGLVVNATAEDGVIEGIESKDHSFVLGVQWHPEFLFDRDPHQRKIFAAFIFACRNGQ